VKKRIILSNKADTCKDLRSIHVCSADKNASIDSTGWREKT